MDHFDNDAVFLLISMAFLLFSIFILHLFFHRGVAHRPHTKSVPLQQLRGDWTFLPLLKKFFTGFDYHFFLSNVNLIWFIFDFDFLSDFPKDY